MAYLWRGLLVAGGLVVLVGGGIFAASELGGEVAVLTTRDAAGKPHSTRVWVVDDGGFTWLRAGQSGSQWLKRLEAEPRVQLERGGSLSNFRATPVRQADARDRLNAQLAAKYGWADSLIGLTHDGGESIAVRLEPDDPSATP